MINKVLAIVLATVSVPLTAQWLNYPDPRIPRTKDGKPNLSAPAPRVNGKVDLTGVWMVEPSPREEYRRLLGDGFEAFDVPGNDIMTISKYLVDILADFKPDQEPIRPEFAGLLRQRGETAGRDLPSSHCLPGGVPWVQRQRLA